MSAEMTAAPNTTSFIQDAVDCKPIRSESSYAEISYGAIKSGKPVSLYLVVSIEVAEQLLESGWTGPGPDTNSYGGKHERKARVKRRRTLLHLSSSPQAAIGAGGSMFNKVLLMVQVPSDELEYFNCVDDNWWVRTVAEELYYAYQTSRSAYPGAFGNLPATAFTVEAYSLRPPPPPPPTLQPKPPAPSKSPVLRRRWIHNLWNGSESKIRQMKISSEQGLKSASVATSSEKSEAGQLGVPVSLVAFTGTNLGEPMTGPQDSVSMKSPVVLWAGSTLTMATRFADGEVRKLKITLQNPLIVWDDKLFGGITISRIANNVHEHVRAMRGNWDGIIFKDAADGVEIADVIVVFPREGSVDHAVEQIGTLTYTGEDGAPEATPGFYDVSFANEKSESEAFEHEYIW